MKRYLRRAETLSVMAVSAGCRVLAVMCMALGSAFWPERIRFAPAFGEAVRMDAPMHVCPLPAAVAQADRREKRRQDQILPADRSDAHTGELFRLHHARLTVILRGFHSAKGISRGCQIL